MRRILLLVVGALALALAAPSMASAHGRHHHHRHHHHRHHSAHRADLSGRAAGTIASFDGTTLTLTLADGSSVGGKVTDQTGIWLVTAPAMTPTAAAAHHGDGWGGWGDGDDQGGDPGHGPCNHGGSFQHGSATDLTAGATVLEAKLDLGPGGATFDKVVVEQPAQS